MKSIRIGNDINIVWSIFDVTGAPYELKKEMKLTLKCGNYLYEIENYTVEDNKITFTFYGKTQTTVGTYMLTLVENDDEVGMQTVDCCKAFKLVRTSCEQTDDDTLNPEVTALDLTSTLDFFPTVTVDDKLDIESENPVQNKVITERINQLNNADVNHLGTAQFYDYTNINVYKNDGSVVSAKIQTVSNEKAGLMDTYQYIKLNRMPNQYDMDNNSYLNLNTCIYPGQYTLDNKVINTAYNFPVLNDGVMSAHLTVLKTTDNNNNVITQFLMLNNNKGGEGNMYVRSKQGDNWDKWGKLQTNVEVGVTNSYDEYTDNGMYSGVFNDGSPYGETFVLIVINDYMFRKLLGQDTHSITQLKYALSIYDGKQTIKTRNKSYNSDTWSNWENVGGSNSGNNYLGQRTLSYLRNDNLNMKSGVYYGTLSDYDYLGAPFILEVSTNFDNGGVQDSAKRAIKKLTIHKQSSNTDSVTEFYSIGRYVNNTAFSFSGFSEQKPMIYDNVLPSIGYSGAHKTLFIDKFDDSLEIPQSASSGKILYQYIINTAKSISNIGSVIINITPNYAESMGFGTLFQSIVEVIYGNKISGKTTPVKYEKMIFNSANGNVYKLQTITEIEQITV